MKLILGSIIILILITAALIFTFQHSGKQSEITQISPVVQPSDVVEKISIREQLSSLMILHSSGTDSAKLVRFVKRYKPAGLIFMRDNIPQDLTQLPTLTAEIQQNQKLPLFIAIDQEGGTVKRLTNDNFPSAKQLKDLPVEESGKASVQRSALIKQYGFNLNFAPVADVTEDTHSFMYPRVFGSDPAQVAEKIAATVTGAKPYVFSTLKHFPGHGETAVDTHTKLATIIIDKITWETRVKPPFEAGIKAGAEFVMLGHLNYSSIDNIPATFSYVWNQILSQELNFQGLIVTDDMIMLQKTKDPGYQDIVKNTIRAINAGNNLILIVNDFNLQNESDRDIDLDALLDGLEKAAKTGELKKQRIEESYKRVNELRSTLTIAPN